MENFEHTTRINKGIRSSVDIVKYRNLDEELKKKVYLLYIELDIIKKIYYYYYNEKTTPEIKQLLHSLDNYIKKIDSLLLVLNEIQ